LAASGNKGRILCPVGSDKKQKAGIPSFENIPA